MTVAVTRRMPIALKRSYCLTSEVVKNALLVLTGHLELPPETNTRVGNVNDALLWIWGIADASQASQFRDHDGPIEHRSRWRVAPQVSVHRSSPTCWSHNQFRGTVSLRVGQDAQKPSLDMCCHRVLFHTLLCRSKRSAMGVSHR